MNPFGPVRTTPAPLILVADDDTHVRELMHLAFMSEQFRVVTAADGDEAIRRVLAERPDLVVLDIRMPRKSGLDVCDYLRHDPEAPDVPVLLVSASADTDTRIDGLQRGADDVLAKPFSPGELVARARRLLARAGEARSARRRAAALERDVAAATRAQRDASAALARERRLRELALGAGLGLQAERDLDAVRERVLTAMSRVLGVDALVLLAAGEGCAPFVAQAWREDDPARFARLSIAPQGELGTLLAGLARPVALHELQRHGVPRDELAACVGAGLALLVPLRDAAGLEAVLGVPERSDGAAWSPGDRESAAALADMAAVALRNARTLRAATDGQVLRAAQAARSGSRAPTAAAEAGAVAEAVAAAVALPPAERGLLRLAVAFGPYAWNEGGVLPELESLDPGTRVRALRRLVERSQSLDVPAAASLVERRCALLAGVCARYEVGRSAGRSVGESWATAMAWVGGDLEPALARELERAIAHASGDRAA